MSKNFYFVYDIYENLGQIYVAESEKQALELSEDYPKVECEIVTSKTLNPNDFETGHLLDLDLALEHDLIDLIIQQGWKK